PALRIHRKPVRGLELTRRGAFLAPGLDELARLVELDDPGIGIAAVAIGNEDVAVRRRDDVGRGVELVWAVAGHARLAERHQHLSVLVELDGRISLLVLAATPVGDPNVVVLVDIKAVREVEHLRAERLHDIAVRVIFGERCDVRTLAAVAATAVEYPHALA